MNIHIYIYNILVYLPYRVTMANHSLLGKISPPQTTRRASPFRCPSWSSDVQANPSVSDRKGTQKFGADQLVLKLSETPARNIQKPYGLVEDLDIFVIIEWGCFNVRGKGLFDIYIYTCILDEMEC